MQIAEGLGLVGGVHAVADGVFREARFGRVVIGVDQAVHGLVIGDFLALGTQPMAEPAPSPAVTR